MKENNLSFLSLKLAVADWFHEASLSFCGVLALASMLAPLLIMESVHNGVVQKLRESLLRDPAILVMIPVAGMGSGFDEAFIEEMAHAPGMRFGIGRVRSVASELRLRGPGGRSLEITLDATAKGDPLLEDHAIAQPMSAPGKLEIVLSDAAARHLDVKAGQMVTGSISRRLSNGKFTRLDLSFLVRGVLPAIAGSRDTGLVDMRTLLSIQDFRDGLHTDLFGVKGDEDPPDTRHYQSFRAYAVSMDDVPGLEKWFKEKDIAVKTRGRDIAAVKKIDSSLSAIIGLIAGAGCIGFFAFMASTARAAARRKWKQLGMLKLIGFHKLSILIYPVSQALLTGILGCLLAFLVYAGIAWSIDTLFAEETAGEAVCVLTFPFLCMVFLFVQVLAILASLRSALKASAISPAKVMREN